jgi:hypothetical protein
MADRYEVLTGALSAHAKKVSGFADRLTQAVDAAQQMSLPTDAYGQCCQDLPFMLNPLQRLGAAALNSSVERLNSTATNVEDTAEDYANIDYDNALALHRAREVR